MNKFSTNDLRSLWLKYFSQKHNHTIIKPASLIPINDDTLLWINSGVAALKNYFDGSVKPPTPRLTNSQPSIRTNDIENVGVTARHHTLFEMLGNFSIGEYFKKEAIHWAWEFLTDEQWLGLEKDKIYITVFQDDEEAYNIWANEIGIDPTKIIKGNKDTNFWEIGIGPCGPNTEMFYDRGEKYDPEGKGIKLLAEDIENDRYLEVWNIVFSQFNNNGDGTYTDLPQKNIDTGMGLERTTAILQGVPTNYDTDQFQIIINEIAKYTDKKYNMNNFFNPVKEQSEINMAYKAIADHVKCNVFAIADGAIPSNEKRGYILRRLLRRSVNMARILGITKPFLSKLVDSVVEYHKEFFPHLVDKREHVIEIIKTEEQKFLHTIDTGYKKLNSIIQKDKAVSASDAFLLFNSFGFPIELTSEIAQKQNIKIDVEGFNKLFEEHKELAKASFKSSGKMNIQSDALNKFNVDSTFLYDPTTHTSKVAGIIQGDDIVQKATGEMWLAFEETIFYVESGGQISDQGTVNELKVLGLMKAPNGTRLHKVNSTSEITLGDSCDLEIWDQRPNLMAHHSGSHLVHQVVKEMFGKDSNQAGKFVANDRIRFDFTTTKKVSSNMVDTIEELVNQKIKENNISQIREMSYDDAIKAGAIALFTEKYENYVRTVKIGESFELCGGTHVKNSSEMEEFTLTSFESKGSGVYRIEGVFTSTLVDKYNKEKNDVLQTEYETFANKHKEFDYFTEFKINKDAKYKTNLRNFEAYKNTIAKLNKEYQKEQLQIEFKKFVETTPEIKDINGINVLSFDTTSSTAVGREVIAHYKNINKDILLIWASKEETKISIIVKVGENYKGKVSAKDVLNHFSSYCETKGGGSDLMAQAGGTKPNGFGEAMNSIGNILNA